MSYRMAVRAGLRGTQQGKRGLKSLTLVCGGCWEVGPSVQTTKPKVLRRRGIELGWESRRHRRATYGLPSYRVEVRCPTCVNSEV